VHAGVMVVTFSPACALTEWGNSVVTTESEPTWGGCSTTARESANQPASQPADQQASKLASQSTTRYYQRGRTASTLICIANSRVGARTTATGDVTLLLLLLPGGPPRAGLGAPHTYADIPNIHNIHNTHAHTRTRTHARTRTRTHERTLARTHGRTDARTHARTHTRTHAYTHTQKRTETRRTSNPLPPRPRVPYA
jgi:hypothetical protein